nr:MAG TPA: hypothetical protein [Caudoviricetes sp.]
MNEHSGSASDSGANEPTARKRFEAPRGNCFCVGAVEPAGYSIKPLRELLRGGYTLKYPLTYDTMYTG